MPFVIELMPNLFRTDSNEWGRRELYGIEYARRFKTRSGAEQHLNEYVATICCRLSDAVVYEVPE